MAEAHTYITNKRSKKFYDFCHIALYRKRNVGSKRTPNTTGNSDGVLLDNGNVELLSEENTTQRHAHEIDNRAVQSRDTSGCNVFCGDSYGHLVKGNKNNV